MISVAWDLTAGYMKEDAEKAVRTGAVPALRQRPDEIG